MESRWGEIFRTYPDRLRGPPSLLYNGYRIFSGGKGGRGVMLTTNPLLVPRLRKSWAITQLTLWVLLGQLRGSLYLLLLMWVYYDVECSEVSVTLKALVMWKDWQILNPLFIFKLYTSCKEDSRLKIKLLFVKKYPSVVSIQALALSMWSECHSCWHRNAVLVFYETEIRKQIWTDVRSPESCSISSLVRTHLKRVIHEQASGYANTENDTDVLQHFVTRKNTAVRQR
jgi:hypothetical protein